MGLVAAGCSGAPSLPASFQRSGTVTGTLQSEFVPADLKILAAIEPASRDDGVIPGG